MRATFARASKSSAVIRRPCAGSCSGSSPPSWRAAAPTATRGRAEDATRLLRKFQGVLDTLGYGGIIVLIDRVDEPQQIEGDPAR